MLKVLTAAEMREVDRLTTGRLGIPSILLMENAAAAVVRIITERLGGSVKGSAVIVVCGPGNNGGDGAAVARMLHLAGANIRAAVIGGVESTKGDARENFRAATAILHNFAEIETYEAFDEWLGGQNGPLDVLIDALFGTGLTRPVDGHRAAIIERMNSVGPCLKLAVDIPSGIDADSAEPSGSHFIADLTVTFTSPKPANVLPPASRVGGELIVADIGSPAVLIDEQPSQLFSAEAADVSRWLKLSEFTPESYKNKRGHALLIAGATNYAGAAVLCGNAAIRSGVGLVTIGTPASSKDAIASRVLPEVMVRPLAETDSGSVAEDAAGELDEFLENIDAVAIGSGLSTDVSTQKFVLRMVHQRRVPTILDADALTLMSPFGPVSKDGPPVILTPHEGEFRKLTGGESPAANDRVAAASHFATSQNVILVLKGERVLIAAPDGRVVVNPTGNSGLGKAGNGDTLAGLLAGFVAQAAALKIDMFETVVAGVYFAAAAGDLAKEKYGERVMTASDVRECFAYLFQKFDGGEG